MGQQETKDLLDSHKKNPKWWSSKEIAKAIGMSNMASVTAALKKLRRTNYIVWRDEGVREKYFYHSAAEGAVYNMSDPIDTKT